MSSPSLGPPSRRACWRALGTSAELLVLGEERQLALAREAVEDWLAQVDLACSRFRPDSELSRLTVVNGQAMRVSPVLIEATQLALRAARLTDGDVDPTLGTALELAGYDRDWTLIEADGGWEAASRAGIPAGIPANPATPSRRTSDSNPVPRLRVRLRAPWTRVRVDQALGTIELPRGVKLDLGATAKAWAADRAAGIARAAGKCGGVLVSLGGDIATSGNSPVGDGACTSPTITATAPMPQARQSRSAVAGLPLQVPRYDGGDAVIPRCTTSSTRLRGPRQAHPGARSASQPRTAPMPTSRPQPRSCAGSARCSGCRTLDFPLGWWRRTAG
jgi:hypothetical protein